MAVSEHAVARAGRTRRTSAPVAKKRLGTKNRALLAFLEELRATPDGMGEEWWAELERELREKRASFERKRGQTT